MSLVASMALAVLVFGVSACVVTSSSTAIGSFVRAGANEYSVSAKLDDRLVHGVLAFAMDLTHVERTLEVDLYVVNSGSDRIEVYQAGREGHLQSVDPNHRVLVYSGSLDYLVRAGRLLSMGPTGGASMVTLIIHTRGSHPGPLEGLSVRIRYMDSI